MTKARASVATPRKDRATGKWGFLFDSVHPGPDGRRRRVHRRGFDTKAAAQTALDQERHDDGGILEPGTLTVAAVLDQFIRVKRLAGRAPGTIHQYQWAAGMAKARWGTRPADWLRAEHLEAAWVEMLAGGRRVHRRGTGTTTTTAPLSARTVEIVHKTVKAAFQLAVDKGQLVRNPARLAHSPKVTDQRRSWWSPEQGGTCLAFVRELDPSPLPAALVEVLVDAGGRRGEVLGLAWDAVDLERATMRVTRQLVADPTTKALGFRPTKRPRAKATIGLHPATVEALRRRRREQAEHRLAMGPGWPGPDTIDAELVFTWQDGTAIHPDVLTRVIARLSTTAGLPRITPHGLRHSFASAALAARVPVEVVAARLGNTPRVVQEVYAHVIPADDAAAARLVGDLYRNFGQG